MNFKFLILLFIEKNNKIIYLIRREYEFELDIKIIKL